MGDSRIADDKVRENLRECVLYLLNFHQGRRQAVSRANLLWKVQSHGFDDIDDRTLRAMIHDLKKEGELIGSTGGAGGGYYMLAGWAELDEYLEREVRARALDLLDQEKVLRQAAEIHFGPRPSAQLALLPMPEREVVADG